MIFLALTANFIVDIVYCLSVFSKEQVVTIDVLQSFNNESLSILVSLESLKGTCSAPVVKECITFPKHDNDKFIFLASSNVSPVAPVLPTF